MAKRVTVDGAAGDDGIRGILQVPARFIRVIIRLDPDDDLGIAGRALRMHDGQGKEKKERNKRGGMSPDREW